MGCFSDEPPHRVDVSPRPVSEEERAVIDLLLTSPLATAELRAQVDAAQVVGVCSCGCPSIFFDTPKDLAAVPMPDAEMPAEIVAAGHGVGDGEWRKVSVTLHIVQGRLEELEVWGGTRDGTNEGNLPDPKSVTLA